MTTIRFDVTDHVARITMHGPKRMNVFDDDHPRGLSQVIDRFQADDGLRVAVLTGSGERSSAPAGTLSGRLRCETPRPGGPVESLRLFIRQS